MLDPGQLAQIRASVALSKKANEALKEELDLHMKADPHNTMLQEHLKEFYANKEKIERMIQVYGG
jgi:DNA-binding SARP family transcriptional activator